MSKSRNNVVQPSAVINKYSADAMRWYLYTASPPGQPRRFSERLVGEVMRQFILPLWNVYSFFVTYANIDNYNPAFSAHPAASAELDHWILSELHDLIDKVTTDLEKYDPTSAGRRIEEFVSSLSNWYVRRSRRRFWKTENDDDKMAAYDTLYCCLETLCRLIAPFTPFLAEAMYKNLVCSADPEAVESVHLASFPEADHDMINTELENSIRLAIRLAKLGRSARSQAGLKIRQPLSAMLVLLTSPSEVERLERVKDQVLEELNVKEVRLALDAGEFEQEGLSVSSDNNYTVAINTRVTPELEAEGLAREIVRHVQTMRRQAGFEIADHIIINYQADNRITAVFKSYGAYISRETLADELVEKQAGQDNYCQSLDLDGCQVILGIRRKN